MGTLAGDKPAWGEEWGYGRSSYRYFGETLESTPDREGHSTPHPANDISGLLFSVVFWVLLGAAIIMSLIGK